ncbi:MAG TPA: TetR/AcrR family transcriptional regulator [Steroidobacteraceae bacterium]|nr:TetR/AcrR family transcriptional regulator [Steroidobacteraceae bacterium]
MTARPTGIPRGRRAQRTAEKRSRITQVASEYIVKHGFEALSVEEVAAEAGISVGGIYRYIDTKTDLLVMACQDIYDGLREQLAQTTHGPGDHLTRLTSALDHYFAASERNRRKIRMMYREYRRLPPLVQEAYKNRETAISDVFSDLVRSGISQGVFKDVNLHALAYDIILLGHLPALKSWAVSTRITSEELRKEQIALIVSRLVPSKTV